MSQVELTVVGSGDAFNSGGRGNACYLVRDSLGAFAVDFGPTAMRGLKERGFEPNDLDGVMLTHLHGDHFGGLHLLLIDAQYRGWRKRPFFIAGPPAAKRYVEAWYKLAYGSAGLRRRFETRYLILRPGVRTTIAGRRVLPFAARHMAPRDGAMMLRISTDGVSLAFSGDTGFTPPLQRVGQGADLFVCECTEARDAPGEHLDLERLRPLLPALGARRVLLSHLAETMRRLAPRLRLDGARCADDGLTLRFAGKRRG